MILLDNKLISEDIIEKSFACDITKCKGSCCVKGDAGAPLLANETALIEENLNDIVPFINPEGKAFIEKDGFHISNKGNLETQCLPTGECVFVSYKNGIATCGIENANAKHHFGFKKPVSCHLYPVRVSEVGEYIALNYHQWDICQTARENGKLTQTPIYIFLKDSLVRAFGQEFYQKLSAYAESTGTNENVR